jgi:Do/DeqQ family serine protease
MRIELAGRQRLAGRMRRIGSAGIGAGSTPRRAASVACRVAAVFALTLACNAEETADSAASDTANRLPGVPSMAAPPATSASVPIERIPPSDPATPIPSLAPLLERVAPAVVNVSVHGRAAQQLNPLMNDPFFRRFFGEPELPREREFTSAGSGVIVDAERGLLLTNQHVIDRADDITVTLVGGQERKAEVVGSDREADIAVLKIPSDGLVSVVEGDSSALRVGDFVVAIGNPFGLGQTVTSGIVSAMGRTGLGIAGYEDFIQTDASINPGNSGGALINLRGELIGINTAIVAPAGGNVGIGFAIPINMARSLMEQIMETGEVKRGQIGVAIQDLTSDLAKGLNIDAAEGALIAQVEPGSPADKAGLQREDLVVAVDGLPVRSSAELRNKIGLLPVGKEVKLEILRGGKRQKIDVKVGERRQDTAEIGDAGALHPALEGATFREAGSTPTSQGKRGVEIVEIQSGSPAARVGLRPGDIIVQVNRSPVTSLEDLRKLVSGEGPRVLAIERGDRALFLALR